MDPRDDERRKFEAWALPFVKQYIANDVYAKMLRTLGPKAVASVFYDFAFEVWQAARAEQPSQTRAALIGLSNEQVSDVQRAVRDCYDKDLYRKLYEEHLRLCTSRSIIVPAAAVPVEDRPAPKKKRIRKLCFDDSCTFNYPHYHGRIGEPIMPEKE